LHEQHEVAGVCHSADVCRNDKPSPIDDFKSASIVEGCKVDSDVPEVVVVAVLSANCDPAVKSEGLVDAEYGFVDVNGRSAAQLVLVKRSSRCDVEHVLAISEDGMEAVLVRWELSIYTVGVAVDGTTIIDGLDYKLDVAGCGSEAEKDSGGKSEQILHVQVIIDSKTRGGKTNLF
jgi:hypothetical protein